MMGDHAEEARRALDAGHDGCGRTPASGGRSKPQRTIRAIVNQRQMHDKMQYKVRYVGASKDCDAWVDANVVRQSHIDTYLKRRLSLASDRPSKKQKLDSSGPVPADDTTAANSGCKREHPSKNMPVKQSGAKKQIEPCRPSERRLQRYTKNSHGQSGKISVDVGLLGAREGDTLHGCEQDTANVVLRIVEGVVAAPAIIRRSVEETAGYDAIISSISKEFNISRSIAEMRYADCPTTDAPNHCPLGQACTHKVGTCECTPAARFKILNQGVWQRFADEHGNGAALKSMVAGRKSVCYRDVLALMSTPGIPGGKTLILRPKLFKVVMGPEEVTPGDSRFVGAQVIDASSFLLHKGHPTVDSTVYNFDGNLFRIPLSDGSSNELRTDNLSELVLESLADQSFLRSDKLEANIKTCLTVLQRLTGGGLKSLLQKTVRFHPKVVDLSLSRQADDNTTTICDNSASSHIVPSPVVTSVCAALLFAQQGSFSPELQLYTRGCTAALKRIAVILIEDAWVQGAEQSVLGLMAMALATQRMPEYHPPRSAVVAALQLISKATESPFAIAWRRSKAPQSPLRLSISSASSFALSESAKILVMLRSFPSDIDMLNLVGKMATKNGSLTLTQCISDARMEVMHVSHMVDQHAWYGVGHLCSSNSKLGHTFADRFQSIFNQTTSFNPRWNKATQLAHPVVAETRFAQACIARFALKCPRKEIAERGQNLTTLKVTIDPGVLAAAVGPVPVKIKDDHGRKKEVLVLLGVRCPEDEIVMIKPARQTRDLWRKLSDNERLQAVACVRGMTLSARSPVLDKGTHAVTFVNGAWNLNGVPWSDIVSNGTLLRIPHIESPSWLQSKDDVDVATCCSEVLESNAAVEEALCEISSAGVVTDAENVIVALVQTCEHAIVYRAVSMLKQQYVKVSMPTTSRQGGIGSDQLMAYAKDWDVYRLLAVVSRLVPGALRPAMPPSFDVVDANLLQLVQRWMLNGLRVCSADHPVIQAKELSWSNCHWWQDVTMKVERELMEHQRAAVASMQERDSNVDTNHFLIMDTGLGKTVTSLHYLLLWLKENGNTARYILWVTPAGTIENLVKQLRDKWGAPVWTVPRVSKSNQKPCALKLKEFQINILHADHLRCAIDAGLAECATYSVICFDEVDEMYAPTQRTSAARRMAQLCQKFVCQTATPMRKNESVLLNWLADTSSFPVDSKNLLVAASAMVSIQIQLGITAQEELKLIPMHNTVRQQCRDLVNKRRWLEMAKLVQLHSDDAMCRMAVNRAKIDRQLYPEGGVLMVANTDEHASKLIRMCNSICPQVRAGGFETLEQPNSNEYGIVVVCKTKDRGYNSACRLGQLVTGVYPGNVASRHQIRGRLRRLGQKRSIVKFCTVAMEHSILHLLHMRHESIDCMNISLEQLGKSFSADILRALEDSA